MIKGSGSGLRTTGSGSGMPKKHSVQIRQIRNTAVTDNGFSGLGWNYGICKEGQAWNLLYVLGRLSELVRSGSWLVPDPGKQKWTTTKKTMKKYLVFICWIFSGGLEASSVLEITSWRPEILQFDNKFFWTNLSLYPGITILRSLDQDLDPDSIYMDPHHWF